MTHSEVARHQCHSLEVRFWVHTEYIWALPLEGSRIRDLWTRLHCLDYTMLTLWVAFKTKALQFSFEGLEFFSFILFSGISYWHASLSRICCTSDPGFCQCAWVEPVDGNRSLSFSLSLTLPLSLSLLCSHSFSVSVFLGNYLQINKFFLKKKLKSQNATISSLNT